jgi:hypothetical protein
VQIAYEPENEPPFYLEDVISLIEFNNSESYNYTTPEVSWDTGTVEITYTPKRLKEFMRYFTDP